MQWIYGEPPDLTDTEKTLAAGFNEIVEGSSVDLCDFCGHEWRSDACCYWRDIPLTDLLSVPRETTQDAGMVVTDIADVPDDESCPMCGANALYERHCEIICGNCRCLVAACSE